MSVAFEQTADLEQCKALQQEEWEVLESIYPDYVSYSTSGHIMKLEVPIELPEPRFVVPLEAERHTTEGSNTEGHDRSLEKLTSSLSTLPPLLLDIFLPPTYPLHAPPHIVSLHATHSWLSGKVVPLREKLMSLWSEGESVLYNWIEWLRNGEFLDALGLNEHAGDQQILRIPHPAPQLLWPLLIEHEQFVVQSRFSQTSYNCQICLTSIKGARCVLLSCSHVFCRPCLEDFWKLCIAEGDVGRVGCPDASCVKASREASEEEVRRVVTDEEVRRWKWLRQKKILDRDPTVIHCPVSICQAPVPKPPNADEGSGWERLRTCPDCGFCFCAYCRRTWHGPITDCPLTSTESFVTQYMTLPEGSSQRRAIEQRYGKANVKRLVAAFEEEQANKKWLDSSTMACPSCRVKVEKSVGCNHMTCARCGQHFCYRCGDKIPASDPYLHFSTPGRPCFSKLFDYQSLDENEWQPVEGFDAL